MRPRSLHERIVNASDRLFGYPADAIHFLHVPKTAGSLIKQVAREVNQSRSRNRIRIHKHDVRLFELPSDQRYFFSTRDPASRFRSAFHWKKSRGAPHFNFRLTPGEERAFSQFASANELAEALFRPDETGIEAALAMKSIRHTSRNLVDSFSLQGFDLFLRPPVWIIRLEYLQHDLAEFLRRIGHDRPVQATGEAPSARRMSYDGVPPLSELAKENLRRWYAQDYEFLRACNAWLEANGAVFASGEASGAAAAPAGLNGGHRSGPALAADHIFNSAGV